jgi:glycerophosphoryl diester phosphodiesterase
MLAHFPRPTVFAHRGSSSHAPENTIAAFERAVEQSAHAIEFDVQLSADGHVVVMHDSTVDRTTDGIGKVCDLSLSTLKQLDAGSFFDRSFRGERIPTLDDVFESAGSRILMNIELKPELLFYHQLPEKVAQVVKHHGMSGRVIFSSFDAWALVQMKKYLPHSPCGLLALPGISGWAMRAWGPKIFPCEALHPHFSSVTESLVHQYHRIGLRIHTYTVNEPDQMMRMFSAGVDGIFTDDPELGVKILQDFLKAG